MTGFFEGRGNPHTTVTPHELGEHQDVTISTPTQGDILQYEESTDTWVNRPIEGLGSGHIIQDEGVSFAQRLSLNFVGDGVEVLDDSPANTTTVSIEQPLTTGIDELDVATSLDGTETGAFLKDGSGVSATTAQLLGDPTRQRRGHGLNYLKGYSDLHKTRPFFSGTNGGLCDAEPWVSYLSGTGAGVFQSSGVLSLNGLMLLTGTTTTGYAAIEHTLAPVAFNPALSYETTFKGGLNAILPSEEAFTVEIGFKSGGGGLATYGLFFQASSSSTYWRAVTNTGSGVSNPATSVLIDATFYHRFKIVRDAVLDVTRFYLNEVLVHTSEPGRINALSPLKMVASIHKTAGTTVAGIFISDHSYKIQTAELVGF